METLPQPWIVAMEATIVTGWIYDHLLPHAQPVKVAHPLMRRATAAAKKKNDQIDASKIADCMGCDSATWHPPRFGIGAEPCATGTCWCARWYR
jgi:transposase